MSTIYDVVTVLAFLAMAAFYFMRGNNDQRLLMHLLVSGVCFAVANQLGNRGHDLLGILLLAAGAGYAVYLFRGRPANDAE